MCAREPLLNGALPQHVCQFGERDVVAASDVGATVVKLLVVMGDAGLGQFAGQEARPEVQLILVAATALEGDDIEGGRIRLGRLNAGQERVVSGLQSPCTIDDITKGGKIATVPFAFAA